MDHRKLRTRTPEFVILLFLSWTNTAEWPHQSVGPIQRKIRYELRLRGVREDGEAIDLQSPHGGHLSQKMDY